MRSDSRVRPSADGRRDRGKFPYEPSGDLKAPSFGASAGLVVTRQEGTAHFCRLNAKPLREIDDWLRDYEAFWSESTPIIDIKPVLEGGCDSPFTW